MAANTEFDKLWDYSDPAKSEERFRELLTETQGSSRVELLTQVARAEGLQDKFDAAHTTLNEAESLLDTAHGIARVRLLLERGRVFNSSKKPDQAAPLFMAAWELACQISADFYAVDAAHMLGVCLPPEEALIWNERAVRLAEESTDPRSRGWLASLYNNIGWTYFDMGNHPKALEIFHLALKCRQERQQVNETQIAKWCVARTLRSLGRVAEALAMQEALYAEHQAAGTHDKYVDEELTECRQALGRGN
jgi:tetratricopeptide (TPR) repeat protein